MLSLLGAVAGSLTDLLQQEGIQRSESPAKAKLTIEPLTPTGQSISFYGIPKLVLQNNPDKLPLPKTIAEYVEMYAIGLLRPTLHYVGNKQEDFNLTFILEDDVEGTPHSYRGGGGTLVFKDFLDLYSVLAWLRALATPIIELNHPPYVRFTFGPWVEVGLVSEVEPVVLTTYKNGYPRVMEINLTIKPDFLLVGPSQTYFEVPQ
jgi:hypothetical protein